MAEDNLNNLIKNYKNMTMEDLGGALLSNQARSRKKARRSQKREDRVLKILAVLLGGQAVFQETYKNRSAELDSLHTIAKMRNQQMAKEMVIVGGILKSIPEDHIRNGTAWDVYNTETREGTRLQDNFRKSVYNQVLGVMTQVDSDGVKSRKATGKLKGDIYDIIDDIIAPYYLKAEKGKQSRAQKLLEAGEKYFNDPNITGSQVFEEMFGINEDIVAANRASRLKRRKTELQGETGWFNVPGLLKSVFKGEPTIFSRVGEDDSGVASTDLQSTLEKDLEIGRFLTPYYSETMASWDNNRDYYDEALGMPELTSRDTGSRMDVALRTFTYESVEYANNIGAGTKSRLGAKAYGGTRDYLMRQAEEAMHLQQGLYGTPAERNKLDMGYGDKFAKTLGGLRRVIDDEGSEGYRLLSKNFGVDLSRLNMEEKDVFAVAVMIQEGSDPVAPDNYNRGAGGLEGYGKPNWDKGRPGEIEVFEKGKRTWSKQGYTESNYINMLDKIDAYIRPTFKGVNDRGELEVNDAQRRLLESDNDANQKIAATTIGSALNTIANKGEPELVGDAYDFLVANLKGFRTQNISSFGSVSAGREAAISGELEYGVTNNTPPGMPIFPQAVPVEVPAWQDPYSARAAIADKGQTGSQVFGKWFGEGWTNQLDREAATRVERHLSGRVTSSESKYQAALSRLNMSDEDARKKYLTVE